MFGICLALGQLSSYLLSVAERRHMGKMTALNRTAQLFAAAMTPLFTGYYVDAEESRILCYVSAAVSIVVCGVMFSLGNFMKTTTPLPTRHSADWATKTE